MPLTALPYVRQPYREDSDAITRLLMERGRVAAEAEARRGDLMAGTVAGLGQQAGAALQQYGEQQALSKRGAALDAALKSWDGKDPKALYSSLGMLDPESRLRVTQGMVALNQLGSKDEAAERTNWEKGLAGAASLPLDVFVSNWPTIRQNLGPGAQKYLNVSNLPDTADESTLTMARQAAQGLGVWKPAAGAEGYTLGTNDVRFGPDNKEVARGLPSAPPAPPTPSFQSKDVLLDGKPAMVNFDARSGRYTLDGQDVTMRVAPIPPQGPRDTRQWVTRNGETIRVAESEIRQGDIPHQAPQNQRLTKEERQDFSAMSYALPKLQQFMEYVEANPDKWGKWDAFRMALTQAIPGLADEEYASQEAFIGRVNAEIRHALYGASLTGGEQQSAEGFIVSATDQPARIMAKVKEAMSRARANTEYYRSLGFNVPEEAPAAPAPTRPRGPNPFRDRPAAAVPSDAQKKRGPNPFR